MSPLLVPSKLAHGGMRQFVALVLEDTPEPQVALRPLTTSSEGLAASFMRQ
jgi:hypothetical protein